MILKIRYTESDTAKRIMTTFAYDVYVSNDSVILIYFHCVSKKRKQHIDLIVATYHSPLYKII